MGDRREGLEGADRDDQDLARRWNLVAVAIALLTGLGAALLPFGTSGSTDSNGLETTMRVSLLSSEGPGMIIVVAIPVLLAALPLMLRGGQAAHRTRVGIVVMLGVVVMLGAASIGVFFVPTLIAMVGAVAARTTTGAIAGSPPDPRPQPHG